MENERLEEFIQDMKNKGYEFPLVNYKFGTYTQYELAGEKIEFDELEYYRI